MMKSNHKFAKNMRGFMCQSPSANAVCMASEPLSVIVQRRRPDRTFSDDHAKLIDYKKYNGLAEVGTRGFPRRSVAGVPSVQVRNGEQISQLQIASSLPSKDQVFQVVVMRVSLHCQGCAGKVKKHLSKMEGVTSFSIDLESKRVTVMGHVSPLGLVQSISKVKRAELWPPSSASASSAAC